MVRSIGLIGLPLLVLICSLNAVFALRCMKCDQASKIEYCTQVADCDDVLEECYLERTTTSLLGLAFNGGCRAKTVCDIIQQLGVGRKRAVSCSECCSTNECNAKLCQQSQAQADHCGRCDAIEDFKRCSTFVQCQNDEACSVTSFLRNMQVLYNVGCEKKPTCVLAKPLGTNWGEFTTKAPPLKKSLFKDDMVICSACCIGEHCNVKYTSCPDMFSNMNPKDYTT